MIFMHNGRQLEYLKTNSATPFASKKNFFAQMFLVQCLVPGPFMILLKQQYSKIWPFFIVDI